MMNNNIFKHIFDTDAPMRREDFFKLSLMLLLFQLLGVGIFRLLYFIIPDFPYDFLILFTLFCVVVELPILYAFFIACYKRMWDILGENKLNIWLSFVFYALMFWLVPLLIVLYLLFVLIPGNCKNEA